MDILDDMGVSKLSTKVFSKVNYSFKQHLITCTLIFWTSSWISLLFPICIFRVGSM